MTAIIDAQMYGPGSAWGARSGIPTHAPVHLVQARRNSLPIAAGSRLRVFLLTSQLAGGFAASRLFPHSSLRSGLLLPSMREGDRLRSLPLVAGRHKFRSPRVGVRRGGCAFVAAPTSRLHFKPTNHVCQDNSDWSERHLQSAFRGRSSMTNHHPKGSEACSPNRGIPLP